MRLGPPADRRTSSVTPSERSRIMPSSPAAAPCSMPSALACMRATIRCRNPARSSSPYADDQPESSLAFSVFPGSELATGDHRGGAAEPRARRRTRDRRADRRAARGPSRSRRPRGRRARPRCTGPVAVHDRRARIARTPRTAIAHRQAARTSPPRHGSAAAARSPARACRHHATSRPGSSSPTVSPSMYERPRVLGSSMPSTRGDASNPAESRWRSRRVHRWRPRPVTRRTVLSTRTAPPTFPPGSGTSSAGMPGVGTAVQQPSPEREPYR